MLTTIDNPYDPYTEYDQWLDWDHEHGYFTQEYMGRLANVAMDTDGDDLDAITDRVIQFILKNDSENIYKIA